jgi:hypothetical protein
MGFEIPRVVTMENAAFWGDTCKILLLAEFSRKFLSVCCSENVGSRLLRNIGNGVPNYMESHLRRQ